MLPILGLKCKGCIQNILQFKSRLLTLEKFIDAFFSSRIWLRINYFHSAYSAVIGGECLGNLQEPFVSTPLQQRQSLVCLPEWEAGSSLGRATVGLKMKCFAPFCYVI